MKLTLNDQLTTLTYKPVGTCSKAIDITLNGNTIEEVFFYGGCPGNLAAVSNLVKGRERQEIIDLLKGTRCGRRNSSCPDQLALALESMA